MRLSLYLSTLEMSSVLNISCINWISHIISQPYLSLLSALVQFSSCRPLPEVPVFYLLCCPLPDVGCWVEEPFRLLIQYGHSYFRNLPGKFINILKSQHFYGRQNFVKVKDLDAKFRKERSRWAILNMYLCSAIFCFLVIVNDLLLSTSWMFKIGI